MTNDEIWKNDALMALNAELGLPMERFGALVRAIRAAEAAQPVFEIGFGWLANPDNYPRGTKLYAAPSQAEPAQPQGAGDEH